MASGVRAHSFLSGRHFGIPLDDEDHECRRNDEDDDEDVYDSEEDMFPEDMFPEDMFPMSSVQRPSYVCNV